MITLVYVLAGYYIIKGAAKTLIEYVGDKIYGIK